MNKRATKISEFFSETNQFYCGIHFFILKQFFANPQKQKRRNT